MSWLIVTVATVAVMAVVAPLIAWLFVVSWRLADHWDSRRGV